MPTWTQSLQWMAIQLMNQLLKLSLEAVKQSQLKNLQPMQEMWPQLPRSIVGQQRILLNLRVNVATITTIAMTIGVIGFATSGFTVDLFL